MNSGSSGCTPGLLKLQPPSGQRGVPGKDKPQMYITGDTELSPSQTELPLSPKIESHLLPRLEQQLIQGTAASSLELVSGWMERQAKVWGAGAALYSLLSPWLLPCPL